MVLINKCLRCGRPLKSLTAKYGPVCLKKVLLEEQQYGNIFDYGDKK